MLSAGCAIPQLGSHTGECLMLDWAKWDIHLPKCAMHLILSSSLYSLKTDSTIWAAQM